MRSNEFGGYGSPYSPEPIGTAQSLLSQLEEVPDLNLQLAEVSEDTPVSELFENIRNAVAGDPEKRQALADIQEVYNTEFIPAQSGIEVGFVTPDGFFTSVAENKLQAVTEGVLFQLVKNAQA